MADDEKLLDDLGLEQEQVPVIEEPTEAKETGPAFERPAEFDVPPEAKEGKEGEAKKGPPLGIKLPGTKAKPAARPEQIKEIETILAKDFGDIYKQLPPQIKTDFKQRGEAAAQKIAEIVNSKKIKPRPILVIIREWLTSLKKLPGINKFFLEQQAKIKTKELIEKHKNTTK